MLKLKLKIIKSNTKWTCLLLTLWRGWFWAIRLILFLFCKLFFITAVTNKDLSFCHPLHSSPSVFLLLLLLLFTSFVLALEPRHGHSRSRCPRLLWTPCYCRCCFRTAWVAAVTLWHHTEKILHQVYRKEQKSSVGFDWSTAIQLQRTLPPAALFSSLCSNLCWGEVQRGWRKISDFKNNKFYCLWIKVGSGVYYF